MPQYDYIKNQIDEIGRFLAQLVSDFLRMKKGGEPKEAVSLVQNSLKEHLNLSLDHLIQITPEETVILLKSEAPASFIHLDHLAKVLFHLADIENEKERKIKLIKQSELFYNYLLDKDPIYSFERHQKLGKIKTSLEKIASK